MIGNLLKLTTIPQRFALGGAAVALVAAVAFNAVQLIENRHLSSEKTTLQDRIENPKTGYVVRLTQAQTNVEQCKTAVNSQNAKIRNLSTSTQATVDRVQQRYDAEHGRRVRAESAAAVILSRKPQGDTATERMADVDAQILGDLK